MRHVRPMFAFISATSLLLMAAVVGQWAAGSDLDDPPQPPMFVMRDRLAREIPELMVEDVELSDVLDFVRDAGFESFNHNVGLRSSITPYFPSDSSIDLDFDSSATKRAGLDPNAKVSFKKYRIPLGSLIAELVKQQHLQCWADTSLVHIVPADTSEEFRSIERRRFLHAPPDLAVSFALDRPMAIPSSPELSVPEALYAAGESADVFIRTDWKAISRVTTHSQIAPGIRHASVRTFLSIVLHDAAPAGTLQFEIRNGQVLVSTRQAFDSQESHIMKRVIVAVLVAIAVVIVAWFLRRRSQSGRWPWLRRAIAGSIVLLAAITFVAAAAMPPDTWEFTAGSRRITFACGGGLMDLWMAPADPMVPYETSTTPSSPQFRESSHKRWNFVFTRNEWPLDTEFLQAPCAATAGLLGVFPLLWSLLTLAAVIRSFVRRRADRCVACGYDLRAVTSLRCPECGAASKVSGAACLSSAPSKREGLTIENVNGVRS